MATKKTIEEIKKFIEEDSGSGCELLSGEYIHAHGKLLIKCNCGETFYTSYKEFKYGKKMQCNDCGFVISGKKQSFSYEEVKNYIELKSDSGCKLLSEDYINNRTKLKIQCKCGEVFCVEFDKFKSRGKQQCNNCSSSKGEKKIIEVLNNLNISYAAEYIYDELFGVGGGNLRFDFAIFQENDVVCLIEYDGELHYIDRPLDMPLEYRKQNDNLKNEYCKNNNIKLVRIPYWNFDNIEKILVTMLEKYNLLQY